MRYLIPFLLFGILLTTYACRQDRIFYGESDAMLQFSLDTLRFDTVFTEVGSATRILKIYNTYDQPIRISNISVESGSDTRFRFNVDGFASNEVQDIEIAGNDSLYIFGEVTVDPDAPLSVSPYVIEDHLVFETNGNTQRVLLEAWGQNANYIPNRFNMGGIASLTCDGGEITWDDPKPYVVYGLLLIDDCTLNIPPGTKIYVHGGITRNDQFGVYNDGFIWALENGTIVATGTKEEPVIIQGDRLEEGFAEIEGQWTGVILGKNSKGHRFEHTIIKNSRFGIFADSNSTVSIKNAQFANFIQSGILAFHSTIDAENTLVYNSNGNSVQLLFGGDYDFDYCTVASYGVDASAIGMSNFFCYDQNCQIAEAYRLNADFTNCIFYGSKRDEIVLSDGFEGEQPETFNYNFTNCIVRIDELTDEPAYADFFENHCENCLNPAPTEAIFVDANEDIYLLDTLSVAEKMAIPLPDILLDLEENERDLERPDIGAFEYQYQ
ncbi:MAG: hypothetical protein AB8G22_24290 [Saprospiraceae bacterium]